MVTIAVELTEEVAEKARAAGILESTRLAELIEAEVERERRRSVALKNMGKIARDLRAMEPPLTQADLEAALRGKQNADESAP